MSGIERIAYECVRNMFFYESAGWYNCIQDGCEECIPATIEDAKESVYYSAMNDYYDGCGWYRSGKAPLEMRFAGEEFIRKVIDRLFEEDEDGDIEVIAEAKGWR